LSGFPGDELIADPLVVIDRHATLAAPVEAVWPWLVQIGKGRGGWYMPAWLERLIPRGRRAVRRLDPRLQDVGVGTEEPDWGPGDPVFRCVTSDPARALVWHSLRDPADHHRWPSEVRPDVLELTWALLLSPDAAGGTDLHIRLRLHKETWHTDPRLRFKRPVFDCFDYLTIVALFAGLRERLA
jgi:hypothetical protein